MSNNNKQDDLLKQLFQQLPDEQLPDSFRMRLMQQVIAEEERRQKRIERYELAAIIIASLFMIAFAILTFIYMGTFTWEWPKFDFSGLGFYFYIGGIASFLLFADYKLRKLFLKKHAKE